MKLEQIDKTIYVDGVATVDTTSAEDAYGLCDVINGHIATLQEEIKAQKNKIEQLENTPLLDLHKAIEPYIAGGSEYTGRGGLIRAITEVGDDKRKYFEKIKGHIIERKRYEKDINSLQEFIEADHVMSWDDVDVETNEGVSLFNALNVLRGELIFHAHLEGQIDELKQALAPFARSGGMLNLNYDDYFVLYPIRKDYVNNESKKHIPVQAFKRAKELTHSTYRHSPKIVCLCGSTRFMDAFQQANLDETLAGNIVLTIGCDMKSDQELFADKSPEELEAIKQDLDKLHKHKIERADEVLILNVDGYIGDSTRSELEYAEVLGKTIRYLEPLNEETKDKVLDTKSTQTPPFVLVEACPTCNNHKIIHNGKKWIDCPYCKHIGNPEAPRFIVEKLQAPEGVSGNWYGVRDTITKQIIFESNQWLKADDKASILEKESEDE